MMPQVERLVHGRVGHVVFAFALLVLGSFADDGDPSHMAGRSRYSKTRQRTRHETIGALDGFAQHPRAH